MSALSEACSQRPFSNGTEGEAWMGVWCEHCTHDHVISHPGGTLTEGCPLILNAMMPDFPCEDFPWPEAWLPEPTGSFSLPSRMICGQFQPCTQGECDGDPHADTRAAIAAQVTAFWSPASIKEDE